MCFFAFLSLLGSQGHLEGLVSWLDPLAFVVPCLCLLVTPCAWQLGAFVLLSLDLGYPAQEFSECQGHQGLHR